VRDKRKRSQDVPVTGLDTLSKRPDAVLVTTRDSRIRLYQGTSSQAVKYKGHKNRISRVAASFSPDGMYVICGSDGGCARPRSVRMQTLSARADHMQAGVAWHRGVSKSLLSQLHASNLCATCSALMCGVTLPALCEPHLVTEKQCAAVFIWRAESEASACLPRARGSYTPSRSRLKCDAYEAFRASHQLVTVAAFVPVVPDARLEPPAPFSQPVKPTADCLLLGVRHSST
jgi:hypothetical protein